MSARCSRSLESGRMFSSACKSRGSSASTARPNKNSTAPRGSGSKCGHPPTTSIPAEIASRARAWCSLPATPVTGHSKSIATWISMKWAQFFCTSNKASTDERPPEMVVSAWVLIDVTPFWDIRFTARVARSTMSSWVIVDRTASRPRIAPMRSPAGFDTRSARKALSR